MDGRALASLQGYHDEVMSQGGTTVIEGVGVKSSKLKQADTPLRGYHSKNVFWHILMSAFS
jgi:hypothetical protein